MDRIEKEAVRALRVVLKSGWGIAAHTEAVPRHDRARRFGPAEQPVGRRPRSAPALVASAQCSGEMRIGVDQIAGGAGIGRPAAQPVENGKIVLGLVDRVGRIGGAGQPRRQWSRFRLVARARRNRAAAPRSPATPQARRRTERAGAAGPQIEAGIGEARSGCSAAPSRQRERQALAFEPALVGREVAADSRTQRSRAGSAPRRSCAGTSARPAQARRRRRSSARAPPRPGATKTLP